MAAHVSLPHPFLSTPPARSWIPVAPHSPFSIANIPFGIISTPDDPTPRPATAIGSFALDLRLFAANYGFAILPAYFGSVSATLHHTTLNAFAELGSYMHALVRLFIQNLLAENTPVPGILKTHIMREQVFIPLHQVTMHMPMKIGDYTDFYAGRHHAYNVGVLFRGPEQALQPNYHHLPVAYHGRASSVMVTPSTIRRPYGQVLSMVASPAPHPYQSPEEEKEQKKTYRREPRLLPTNKLDYELELGAFVSRRSTLGQPVLVADADQYIFGFVLLIDWSARDVQAWEYVPLGPFTSKNFGTTISPWVVLPQALEAYKTEPIPNEVPPLSYLREPDLRSVYSIDLSIHIQTKNGTQAVLSRTNSSNIMWSWRQMISHHTVSGCNLRTGDLLATGTISGPSSGSEGSLLEATYNGTKPIQLPDGSNRYFLEDGDTIIMTGVAGPEGSRVGFGDVQGTILASDMLGI